MAELETGGDGPADGGQSAPVGPALSRADVLIALGHGKGLIARIVAATVLLGIALALVLPPIYQRAPCCCRPTNRAGCSAIR